MIRWIWQQHRQEDWQKIVYFSVKRFKKQRLAKREAGQEEEDLTPRFYIDICRNWCTQIDAWKRKQVIISLRYTQGNIIKWVA